MLLAWKMLTVFRPRIHAAWKMSPLEKRNVQRIQHCSFFARFASLADGMPSVSSAGVLALFNGPVRAAGRSGWRWSSENWENFERPVWRGFMSFAITGFVGFLGGFEG